MKTRMHESGQATIMVLLSMLGLLGFVGLGTDVGLLFHAKRNLQIVADAAAIAGASEAFYSGASGATTAATNAATANGVTDGTAGATVKVNDPPLSGAHTGPTNSGYVEVVVSQPQKTVFMGLFGWNSVPVSARAVAYKGAPSINCVYVMSPTASPAMDLQGSFNVNVPNCGIIVDSPQGGALHFTGAGGTLTAGSVGVVGTVSGQTQDSTPAPISGAAPVSDPFPNLTMPTPSGACSTATTLTGAVSPGCYSASGITISNATLGAGTYLFTSTGGTVQFNGTVTGIGVTLYTKGTINFTNGTLDLEAPTSGTYNGFAIIADRSDTAGQLLFDKGSASGIVKGIIYAPDTQMILHDSGGDKNGGLQLVVDLIVATLYDQTATLSLTSYTQSVSTSPLTRVTLVE